MDMKALLDQLLNSGRQFADQGRDKAEKHLGVPEQGPERDAMVSGMGKGALAAGALGLLLGTGAGRRIGGSALKLGSLAALGGLAYKTYQNWQSGRGQATDADSAQPIGELGGDAASQRALALIRAMIGAAKADGHVDDQERENIKQQVQRLGIDAAGLAVMEAELDKPLDPNEIAAGADSKEAAAEIYLVSLLVIDVSNPLERAYLKTLAEKLGLAEDLVAQLETAAG